MLEAGYGESNSLRLQQQWYIRASVRSKIWSRAMSYAMAVGGVLSTTLHGCGTSKRSQITQDLAGSVHQPGNQGLRVVVTQQSPY